MTNSEKLKYLSISYVLFGIAALAMLPLMEYSMEFLNEMLKSLGPRRDPQLEKTMKDLMNAMETSMYLMTGVHVAVNFLVAWALIKRKFYWPCFITGILNCLAFPIGTPLGIFTVIILQKDEVKKEFGIAVKD